MIIYISDRSGKIVYSTSTALPNNRNILSDETTDDVETGIRTATISIYADQDLDDIIVPGNFLLQRVRGEAEKIGNGNEMYTIIEVTYKAGERSYELYCEDAGLDLLNYTSGSYTNSSAVTLKTVITAILGSSTSWNGWTINFDSSADTKTTMSAEYFSYTSEETMTSRLLSILESYECEMYFSYEIQGLKAVKRYINIVKSRGSSKEENPKHIFHVGKELSNITKKGTIEELANAFTLYGQNSEGTVKALSSLTGYSTYSGKTYSPTDTTFSTKRKHTYMVSGNSVICTDQISNWVSPLNGKGLITKIKYTEYTSAKDLIMYAIREIEKVVDVDYSYEIEFIDIHYEIQTGDYIKIVDEYGNVYVEARVKSWKRSEISNTYTVELSDYTKLEGSKAATNFSKWTDLTSISVTSSSGLSVKTEKISTILRVSIFSGGNVITTSKELKEKLGESYHLQWYNSDGTEVDRSDSRLSDEGFIFTISDVDSDQISYTCKLNDGGDSNG